MDIKILSARIIHAINYFEFLNRKIFDHNALPQQKLTKTNSSLRKETKQIQREHINKENFWKTCIKHLKIWRKRSAKSGSGLLRIYSLQCLTQNNLNRRVEQLLYDPGILRKVDKWENQSLDDLLGLGPRPWGISGRVTDQRPTHDSMIQ